ncbi:MAG: hypothetical protein QM589_12445 [Thermomicrobiales bacterium]
MSHRSRRGRPPRQYSIRARTERRDPIDYAALAQAALEQAAMDQRRDQDRPIAPPRIWGGRDAADRTTEDALVDDQDTAEGAPS